MRINKPSWQTLTVGQYQELYRLSLSTGLDDFAKLEKAICIVYNLSENQVDDLSITKFKQLASEVSFVFESEVIPGKAQKYIKAGTKKYLVNYNVTDLTHGQYVSIQHFADKPIENMHYILACVVNPVRFGIKLKNKADHHLKYAEQLKNARMIDVYNSCVFFCKVYTSSIKAIRGYLEAQMMMQGKTKKEAMILLSHSINAMDGFIQQKNWQNLSVSA